MLGMCSVSLLEALAGSWIAIFATRRRLMCCMGLVFEALGIADQKAVIRLSPEITSELWMLALLGPLSATNLRAQFHGQLLATDSSLDYMAGVAAEIPVPIAQEVSKRSLKRGIWSRLLSDEAEWRRSHGVLDPSDEVPGDGYSAHPLWELLARSLTYKEQWRRKIVKRKHINITELGAHLYSERRLSSNARHLRVLYGLDSQVSLGGLVKGRSSSPVLNAQLRRALPWALGSDLYSYFLYFPSAHNRADDPTRNRDVQGPDVPLASWWDDAANGCFESYDKWLADQDCDNLDNDLDFDSLTKKSFVDVRAGKQLRKDAAANSRRDKVPCAISRAAIEPRTVAVEKTSSGLCERSLELLAEFNDEQFFFPKGSARVVSEPGVLGLFSGTYSVAKAMLKHGAPWVLSFEILRNNKEDLSNKLLQDKLLELVRLGAFKVAGAAPTCCSFSTAVTPAVRSNRFPRGIPGLSGRMRQKGTEGNGHADFLAKIFDAARSVGCYFWCENPDRSFIWKLKRWKRFRDPGSPDICRVSFCRFGTPWQKNTRLATDVPALIGLRLMCDCGSRPHLVLRGRSSYHKKSWTAVAQPYPRGFSNLIAKSCCLAAGWQYGGKLKIASCARAGSLRIGEASNPGPRGRRTSRSFDIEAVSLRTPATEALEARLLDRFVQWASGDIASVSVDELFNLSPSFCAQAARTYGLLEFRQGGALSNFRHLLLALQNWKPMVRPYMTGCWQLVGKWELIEPVDHRPPIPESVVKALVVYAWQLGWLAWCGVTLITFYGAGRVGETLRCNRGDLLFPKDILDSKSECVFLQLRQFKSLGRQPARVQHVKIVDTTAIRLLTAIYEALDADKPLYPAGPSVYRRRWDYLIQNLGIPHTANLTPGCLRAGASVAAYRAGRSISDIMWLMRLRSQTTLESYLQEVAAVATLRALTTEVRDRLFKISSLFEFLVVQKPGP